MGRDRVTIQEAARHLGIKEAAVRKRIERGTLEKEKDADGRVYVYVEEQGDGANDAGRDGSYYASHPMGYDLAPLAESQREQIAFLREQLEAERRAHGEARRLLAAALERIPPQLEAPQASEEPAREPAGGAVRSDTLRVMWGLRMAQSSRGDGLGGGSSSGSRVVRCSRWTLRHGQR